MAISDIHGCYDEFNALLHKANYNPSEDKLILLGDYIDRGLKSKQVVEQVKSLVEEWGVIALKGNHDDMMVKALSKDNESFDSVWLSNGAFQTIANYCGLSFFEEGFVWEEYDEAKTLFNKHFKHHIDFLKSLPLYHETESHIFVHGGVNPFLADWKNTSKDDFLWIREVFHNNKVDGTDKTIVFGHTPTINLHGVEDIWFSPDGKKIGIDGGAFKLQMNCLEINKDGYKAYSVRRGERI